MPSHLDPAAMRWELHRVWNVEANLRPNERHVHKKKVFYLDEDSWLPSVYFAIDQADNVHHVLYTNIAQGYDYPCPMPLATEEYDFAKGAYTHMMFSGPVGGITSYGVQKVKPETLPANMFLPEGLAGRNIR